ncbi:hypothetical protein HK096_001900 [Nowakowskiella sp. JEL0078]|nr:hypothetical protein HK096_001900 [Nowakowskiella sp. JEL0078]
MSLRFIPQNLAAQIDVDLMNPSLGGYSIDQLMELAGFSVAQALTKIYGQKNYKRVLVCAGPGNNGGDGLVAARHLSHFGYIPKIFYPKRTNRPLFNNLITQCTVHGIQFVDSIEDALDQSDLVLDGIFGDLRTPFDKVIEALKNSKLPIVSIDIPSGWDVERGNLNNGIEPDMLISLTAPKEGVRDFKGTHFLGGRFIPPQLAEKWNLNLPQFEGESEFAEDTMEEAIVTLREILREPPNWEIVARGAETRIFDSFYITKSSGLLQLAVMM